MVRRRSSSCMSNVGRCHASLMIHVNSFVFFFRVLLLVRFSFSCFEWDIIFARV